MSATLRPLRSVVVVGGSIAAVTAAKTLRAEGFDGDLTVLSEERHRPYSRVPLSKSVLRGDAAADDAELPGITDDIRLRLGATAIALDAEHARIVLADGEEVPYDGLVVASGARARRIGRPQQGGELVLRTRDDAGLLLEALSGAETVVVVGGGLLGMEIASTCRARQLAVTVVDREPPLRAHLGVWLADLAVSAAVEQGIRFVIDRSPVSLLGNERIEGVVVGGRRITADVVVTACGDVPNTEWLESSGLAPGGRLVVDDFARVAPGIVAAGDAATHRRPDGSLQRAPFWTNAVAQGVTAARTLISTDHAPSPADPYLWTEHTGFDLKVSGPLPVLGAPEVLAGSVDDRSALLRWHTPGWCPTAATVNYRMSIVALKRLGAKAEGKQVVGFAAQGANG